MVVTREKIMQKDPHEMARRRWKMLARALHKNKEIEKDDMISVRRITSFGLLSLVPLCEVLTSDEENSIPWFEYKTTINQETFMLKIRHLVQDITPVDLMGFNNTGNICVWPSEEVLAYYILCNREFFDDKTVLELGGGMTCLAGLLAAKYTRASFIHLTDGNKSSIDNVCTIIKHNCIVNSSSKVICSLLKWGENQEQNITTIKYDLILAADCLFFDEARKDLVLTIKKFLKSDGTALITAPRRGTTLDEFIKEANKMGFNCKPLEFYNEKVWQRHLKLKEEINYYDQDIHYPILIYINKINYQNNKTITTATITATKIYNNEITTDTNNTSIKQQQQQEV